MALNSVAQAIQLYFGESSEHDLFMKKNKCTVICDICKDAAVGDGIPLDTLRELLKAMYPSDAAFHNLINEITKGIKYYEFGLNYLNNENEPIANIRGGDTQRKFNLVKSNVASLQLCTSNDAALFQEGGGFHPKCFKSFSPRDAIYVTPAGPLDPGSNINHTKIVTGQYDFNEETLQLFGLPDQIIWSGGMQIDKSFKYKINLRGEEFEFNLYPNSYTIGDNIFSESGNVKLLDLVKGNKEKNFDISQNCNSATILIPSNKLLCILMLIFKEMGDLMQVLVFINALKGKYIDKENIIFTTSDHVVFTQIRDF